MDTPKGNPKSHSFTRRRLRVVQPQPQIWKPQEPENLFEHLVPSRWHCLGRKLWNQCDCELANGSGSLGAGLEGSSLTLLSGGQDAKGFCLVLLLLLSHWSSRLLYVPWNHEPKETSPPLSFSCQAFCHSNEKRDTEGRASSLATLKGNLR